MALQEHIMLRVNYKEILNAMARELDGAGDGISDFSKNYLLFMVQQMK